MRKLAGGGKLQRLWQVPCEVLQVVSGTRFKIDTADGVHVLPTTRLKYYVAPQGKRKPFHFYCTRHNPGAHTKTQFAASLCTKTSHFS